MKLTLNKRSENKEGEVGTVGQHDSSGQKQSEEPSVVASTQAVVHPNAMMVSSCNTGPADAAVLAPSGFEEPAGAAVVARIVQYAIVWIALHLAPMVGCRNVGGGIVTGAQVGEEEGKRKKQHDQKLVMPDQARPHGRHEEGSTDGDKAEEENDNDGMLLIHQIVAQPRPSGGDAPIGEAYVQSAQAPGNMEYQETVEEANRSVPKTPSVQCL